jgi:hypothetical protein
MVVTVMQGSETGKAEGGRVKGFAHAVVSELGGGRGGPPSRC